MKEFCIFRVQNVRDMWRVMESSVADEAGRFTYRIIHYRRVVERFKSTNGQRAIEQCMRYAMGCSVNIYWKCSL